MKIIEALKKRNRTLLEMYIGIFFLGILAQFVGAFFTKDLLVYTGSLWFGLVMAGISAFHMYRTLDRALDYDEKTATKLIFSGYMTRYVLLAIILLIVIKTNVLNPIIVFVAYMSLKGTAYLQPFTHKLCNRIFQETDPIPEAMPEEASDENSNENSSEDFGEDFTTGKMPEEF